MYQSILVPVDGSVHSGNALEVAANLVDRQHGVLYVLNVQQVPVAKDTLGHLAGAPAPGADDAVQSAGRAVIDDISKGIELNVNDVRPRVRSGQPAEVIVSEARELGVDAIVLGSRGMGYIASVILGSVSHQVLHEAPCRVIVVR